MWERPNTLYEKVLRYIQHPVRGKIPFHLFNFQERTLTEFDKERYNIVLKSRQTGISTLKIRFFTLENVV